MIQSKSNPVWFLLLFLQMFVLTGICFFAVDPTQHLTGYILLAVFLLLIQLPVFGWLKLNTFKENTILFTGTLCLSALAISSGGLFDTLNRFWVSCMSFFVLFQLIYREEKRVIPNLVNWVYASSGYTALMASAGLSFGSSKFYPVMLAPFIVMPVALVICSYFKPWYVRILTGFIFCWIMAYQAYPEYIAYVTGKKFSKNESIYSLKPLTNEDGKVFQPDEAYPEKIWVLDFWHSRCGACFQGFPHVQSLWEMYKDDTSVIIAAVNVPLKSDSARQYVDMLKEYSFSRYRAIGSIDDNQWSIDMYPTTLVIDRLGRIRFKGLPNYKPGVHYLPDIIEELKKE